MAEETNNSTIETTTSEKKPAVSPAYDPLVPDVYSNNSEIIMGETDISIAFFQDIGFPGSANFKTPVRIVMSHAVFVNFVSYCNTRAKLLQNAYGESIPTILKNGKSDEELRQAAEDMFAGRKVVARFEFSDESNK